MIESIPSGLFSTAATTKSFIRQVWIRRASQDVEDLRDSSFAQIEALARLMHLTGFQKAHMTPEPYVTFYDAPGAGSEGLAQIPSRS